MVSFYYCNNNGNRITQIFQDLQNFEFKIYSFLTVTYQIGTAVSTCSQNIYVSKTVINAIVESYRPSILFTPSVESEVMDWCVNQLNYLLLGASINLGTNISELSQTQHIRTFRTFRRRRN